MLNVSRNTKCASCGRGMLSRVPNGRAYAHAQANNNKHAEKVPDHNHAARSQPEATATLTRHVAKREGNFGGYWAVARARCWTNSG